MRHLTFVLITGHFLRYFIGLQIDDNLWSEIFANLRDLVIEPWSLNHSLRHMTPALLKHLNGRPLSGSEDQRPNDSMSALPAIKARSEDPSP